MNRRKFLKIAGSASVIMGAAATGFITTRKPEEALKAWENVGKTYTDPMRRALSYAILAPNPHNRQPWLVDLKSETEAVLLCDLDRLLPVTDPFSRQIMIGLGCFLELFTIAAAEQGYEAKIEYFPEGQHGENLDKRPIAHLTLKEQKYYKKDELFAHVLKRHTNREPYDINQPISNDIIGKLQKNDNADVNVGASNTGALLDDLRILTRDAIVKELRTPDAYQESVDLMRIGRSEIEANPDGISLGGPFLETLNIAGVLTKKTLADTKSSSFQIGIDMVEEAAMTSMGFVWVSTKGQDRISQIKAGRSYMRLALQVAENGLVMQPMSQALQEYDEMKPFFKVVHAKLTDNSGDRLQMLARIGYAKDVGPAPRWALATRIKG